MSTIENMTSSPLTTRSNSISHHYINSKPVFTQNYNNTNGEHSSYSNDPSAANVHVSFAKDEKKHLNPYEKLLYESQNDARFKEEERAGRRIGFYRIIKDIGVGNFSRVKLGTHLLAKEKVAIKILDKTKLDASTQRLLLREITSMEKLSHPNIIRLYEVIKTPTHIYIVTEYASGGDLYTHITDHGKMAENEVKCIFAQITAAVDHMHSKGIVHRDIKCENVFFAKEHLIKLGDFGFSTYSQKNQTLTTFCGSPPYAAPELYRDKSYIGVYVDIWALGVTLYFMMTGLMPFRAENVAKLRKAIIDGNYSIPLFISNQCQELIHGLLNYETSERWSIEKIRSCSWLAHENFPKEFYSFSSNLRSPSSSEISSFEYETHLRLKELGITPELLQTNDENSDNESLSNRDHINGTYRILLHRSQKQSNSLERDELYDKRINEDIPSSWSRSMSLNGEANGQKIKQRLNNSFHAVPHSTKVCVIL